MTTSDDKISAALDLVFTAIEAKNFTKMALDRARDLRVKAPLICPAVLVLQMEHSFAETVEVHIEAGKRLEAATSEAKKEGAQ